MADPLVNVAFDPKTLAISENFLHFASFLDPEMAIAMQKIATLLQTTAEANTWTAFKNPQGDLAGSILGVVVSPYEAVLQVNVPYAWRLERGFGPDGSDATDSMGRTYHNPAEPYAMPAVTSNEDTIIQFTEDAMFTSFDKAGGK